MNEINRRGTGAPSSGAPRPAKRANEFQDAVFVTWERHRRTLGIAEYFNIPLLEVVFQRSRWRRYPWQFWRTFAVLVRSSATKVIVQNPSLVLSVSVVLWRRLFARGRRIVVDAHNQAVVPFMPNNGAVRALSRFVLREADLIVVTNRFLVEIVENYGGRAIVLPDRLPVVTPCPALDLDATQAMRLLVIATFAPDEPIEEIFQAAQLAGPLFHFYFTGNFRKLSASLLAEAGANVSFLGFIDEPEYWRAMTESHAVIDLTLMPDCLVCGAYEAVAVGRPAILTDTAAQREYFLDAGHYAQPTAEGIAEAIRRLRDSYGSAVAAVGKRREVLAREWGNLAARAAERISTLT